MSTSSQINQEAAEDLFFGQTVIIWARWFIIAGSAMTTLWTARTIGAITINVLLVVALMALNFFLHARYLVERPVNRALLIGVSALDLLLIGATVATWQNQIGLTSPFFILFYPAVLAFAFVFPPRLTALYTSGALLLYSGICLLTNGPLLSVDDLKLLVMRLITLAAMGGLGTYYWRIQRGRRRSAQGASATLAELQQHLRANPSIE
jgi:hypothetical protein